MSDDHGMTTVKYRSGGQIRSKQVAFDTVTRTDGELRFSRDGSDVWRIDADCVVGILGLDDPTEYPHRTSLPLPCRGQIPDRGGIGRSPITARDVHDRDGARAFARELIDKSGPLFEKALLGHEITDEEVTALLEHCGDAAFDSTHD